MPASRLKVRLLQRIAHIGKEGEIVEVSHAQAMNSLIPKGLAIRVTPEDEKRLADEKKRQESRVPELARERYNIRDRLHMQKVICELTGLGEKVFGGVTEDTIVRQIKETYDVDLDRGHITLPDGKHIKKVGTYDIRVHLGHDVYIRMDVEVRVRPQQK